jgi:large subunit ribosomal protein L19
MEKLEVYSKIRPGDRIRVYEKLKGEEGRETIFEGILISKKHGTGVNATFCVREVIDGVGVEKIYPLHSPLVSKIELLKKGRGKRAKLYWIREKPEREIRKKLKV